MNHNRLYFLLLLFAFSLGIPGLAQKRCISQDWNFCRISDETSKAEIKNQGSDWSSQYNVQHMDMNGNSELAVPQNTLGAELRQLENNYSSAYAICRTIDCAASMARYLLLQKKDYHYAGGGEEAYLDRV